MNNPPISDQNLIMDKSMRSVFVGNIPYEATEENLKDIFSEVGTVLSFKLVFDRETGKPKGYGFCEYKDPETALSAMRNLNSYEIGGRTLRVDNACTEKSRMEMQNLLTGQNTENPYGDPVQFEKAPEAISKAVATLQPEQMFELMKQMKLCVQNNPSEARQMLLQNPQLAYAILQAQVVLKIVDPHTAVGMLHKANPIPNVLAPSEKVPPLSGPPRIEEPWAISRPPPVTNAVPPPPIFAGQDVDLRNLDTRALDPRITRMDQDLRGPPQPPPPPSNINPPTIVPAPSDVRPPVFVSDSIVRDPRGERFGRDPREVRDVRMPADPRISKSSQPITSPVPVPRPVGAPPIIPPQKLPSNSAVVPPATMSPTASSTTRLMAGMSSTGNIPSEATDQEKAALIMQVLQLSDEQIATLPPEQRQSILVLKEQIAKSTQR